MSALDYSSVEEFVKERKGKKIISKILIANNGIAAVKEIRSVRQWAYDTFGTQKMIKFVVMATPEDLKVNAEYLRMADQIVEVPGGPNNNNYANVELIVDLAERTGVQAVWAGWGHASENPRLPNLLSESSHDIEFIGPPGGVMQTLGDKIVSTLVAQNADVSCVPWSGSEFSMPKGKVSQEIIEKAAVKTVEQCKESIEKIGFPCMIKASEGGGGKGIRKVTSMDQVEDAFRQVQGELKGSPVFTMKMVENARHLEVQIIADKYGEAISLSGRDCSVQRRHQKIIEEGPPPAAPEIWSKMEAAAVRLSKECGYVGAGTIEYLFSEKEISGADEDTYYFLEMNPRLQVEHPVTEEITAVNLPALQLQVAMGISLSMIPEIRRFYGEEKPYSTHEIELLPEKQKKPQQHVIAVRITGENPNEGFKPTPGQIHELSFKSTPNVWGYFSVGSNGGLHEYADSQFGHLFARGINREAARKAMVIGLKEIEIRGEIQTPVEYVVKLLESSDYIENKIHTGWLDGLIQSGQAPKVKITQNPSQPIYVAVCGAIYKTFMAFKKRKEKYLKLLNRGQTPNIEMLTLNLDSVKLIFEGILYHFHVVLYGPLHYSLCLHNSRDSKVDVHVRPIGEGGLLVLLDEQSNICYGRKEPGVGLKFTLNGTTHYFPRETDPTILRATSAGKLIRFLVEDGSKIAKGTAYCEIEVMKMYLSLVVGFDGVIKFQKMEGASLEIADVIANLELEDASQLQKTEPFSGELPNFKPPQSKYEKSHQKLRQELKQLNWFFEGYQNENIETVLNDIFDIILKDKEFIILEFNEALATINGRVAPELIEAISSKVKEIGAGDDSEIGQEVEKLVMDFVKNSDTVVESAAPVLAVCERFYQGRIGLLMSLFTSVFKRFGKDEILFQKKTMTEVISELRRQGKEDIENIVQICLSHHRVSQKDVLMLNICDKIIEHNLTEKFEPVLKLILKFTGKATPMISRRAKQILGIEEGEDEPPSPVPQIRNSVPQDDLSKRRFQAQDIGTTYVYDFLDLFTEGLRQQWESFISLHKLQTKLPGKLLEAQELVLEHNEDGTKKLVPVDRPIGQNTIGMIAWRVTLYTPEIPTGRQIIIIANDITFQNGSFGLEEDYLFFEASQLAREEGLPRIYLSSNSGARIGLAEEVKKKYEVAWKDSNDKSKGFSYLYVKDEVYQNEMSDSVKVEKVETPELGVHWKITDVIGNSTNGGLGVENLKGSGLIAGETSRAYQEVFTITLVTGRSVGIGAYLVRLGQRAIQNEAPIILTGAPALNKVLGRKVYESNSQIGGSEIMWKNGVSHLIVNDELKGCSEILTWISYIPAKKDGPLPIIEPTDLPTRKIEYTPEVNIVYDPRDLINGVYSKDGEWVSGFFDQGSFKETLTGWAKTVVCGRARLGGIPVGVIAVETRTIEQRTPADPADPDSGEYVVQQAGQVWYPDSSFKTSEAIEDFNKGEQLPLIMLANWRGFSGGMRDMFLEILKFGSLIVDKLREYKQPVFIYIPPFGDLRGGAWAVLDPSINYEQMEMYADEKSKAGILEAPATVEIKYRSRDLLATMDRLDTQIIEINTKLTDKDISEKDRFNLLEQKKNRQESLMPIYQQIAIKFADLHDTPGRMLEKKCIRKVIQWENARTYFYYRLRRRLAEEHLINLSIEANPKYTRSKCLDIIKEWATNSDNQIWEDDEQTALKLEDVDSFKQTLSQIQKSYLTDVILRNFDKHTDVVLETIAECLQKLTPEKKMLLKLALTELVS